MNKRLLKIFVWISMCAVLFLSGCTKEMPPVQEEGQQEELMDAADVLEQVLEIGVLINCGNDYTMTVYEAFRDLAGKSSRPIVAELHDNWGGYELQKSQLELTMEHGIDILLVEIADSERQQELLTDLKGLDVPVIFIGAPPSAELLEELQASYIGIAEDEEDDLERTLEEDLFEGSAFQEQAKKSGEDLLNMIIKMKSK